MLVFSREGSNFKLGDLAAFKRVFGQIGHCIDGNFNIHIWAWSASPSVQVGKFIEKYSVSLERIFTVRDQLSVFCPLQRISFVFSNGKHVTVFL